MTEFDLSKAIEESQQTTRMRLLSILQRPGAEHTSLEIFAKALPEDLKSELMNMTSSEIYEVMKTKVRVMSDECEVLRTQEDYNRKRLEILEEMRRQEVNTDRFGWTGPEICSSFKISKQDLKKIFKGDKKLGIDPLVSNGNIREMGNRVAKRYIYFRYYNKMCELWLENGKKV